MRRSEIWKKYKSASGCKQKWEEKSSQCEEDSVATCEKVLFEYNSEWKL